MKFANIIVAASLALVAGNALAADKNEPNCEVKGQKEHVADKKACEGKQGKWLEAAKGATPAEAGKTEQKHP